MTKTAKILFIILFIFCSIYSLYSQNSSQTIRGVVVDRDSKFPLPGVNIILLDSAHRGTISNPEGEFILEKSPMGRHTSQFAGIG